MYTYLHWEHFRGMCVCVDIHTEYTFSLKCYYYWCEKRKNTKWLSWLLWRGFAVGICHGQCLLVPEVFQVTETFCILVLSNNAASISSYAAGMAFCAHNCGG